MVKERHTVQIDDVRVVRETALAILVEIEEEEHWIPKSIIHEDSEVRSAGDEGSLVLPEWFAEKEMLV